MTGSYAVIGHPINVAGVTLRPQQLTASWGLGAQGDWIPVASLSGGAAEASALIGIGNATALG
jgi:hypothetical protein